MKTPIRGNGKSLLRLIKIIVEANENPSLGNNKNLLLGNNKKSLLKIV